MGMAKICNNCACYEVCFMANPGRTVDCNLNWRPIIVQCKDCEYTCPGTSGLVCTMWGAGTDPDGWCYEAERKNNGKTSL